MPLLATAVHNSAVIYSKPPNFHTSVLQNLIVLNSKLDQFAKIEVRDILRFTVLNLLQYDELKCNQLIMYHIMLQLKKNKFECLTDNQTFLFLSQDTMYMYSGTSLSRHLCQGVTTLLSKPTFIGHFYSF
jgi:hypothetical protein